MKKNKENYLERVPKRHAEIQWSEEDGKVSLAVRNKGFYNRLAQLILKKPEVSYIHLDEMGSFIWNVIDGEKNIIEIGKEVEERFGDSAKPLYERLAQYMKTLENCKFISYK